VIRKHFRSSVVVCFSSSVNGWDAEPRRAGGTATSVGGSAVLPGSVPHRHGTANSPPIKCGGRVRGHQRRCDAKGPRGIPKEGTPPPSLNGSGCNADPGQGPQGLQPRPVTEELTAAPGCVTGRGPQLCPSVSRCAPRSSVPGDWWAPREGHPTLFRTIRPRGVWAVGRPLGGMSRCCPPPSRVLSPGDAGDDFPTLYAADCRPPPRARGRKFYLGGRAEVRGGVLFVVFFLGGAHN